MNILDANMSLYEIENCLEKQCFHSYHDFRIIGDLDLSMDDLECLSYKVKGLRRFAVDLSTYETYKLSLLTACVFKIKKEQEIMGNIYFLRKVYNNLPQHHTRFVMELLKDTLIEYGIATFNIDTKHFNGLFGVLINHAGIPEHLHGNLYDLLDETLQYNEVGLLESKFRKEFVPHLNWWTQYIEEQKMWELFIDCRNLLIDCKSNEFAKEELLKKYHWVSKNLIQNCVKWCNECEYLSQEQRKILV
ncbi:hypothetical protein [Anaeromicropila herbilytica]|uniref:Uncharacterized protein n=1 Tax=Anaeromicropila herbilytica TaxID=2785025 RepID=A0A7R7IBJ1_9FIRM|nr:hypothetical protein [Anaeromicropila herbilytica]BCN28849.1 hypothetical protein bsdtb5_01440 [Anaeromicropila herbilytica]